MARVLEPPLDPIQPHPVPFVPVEEQGVAHGPVIPRLAHHTARSQ